MKLSGEWNKRCCDMMLQFLAWWNQAVRMNAFTDALAVCGQWKPAVNTTQMYSI